MAKKQKNAPSPKIAKVKITGRLDSLTDMLKLRLFEYSPQSVEELVKEAQKSLLRGQTLPKIQKNVNRCLTKNPCFRSEGKGFWCLRLDGLKENDAAHRILQVEGDALRFSDINYKLKTIGKVEVPAEQKLVSDGRFLRLKDGRWGLIHWAYIEPVDQGDRSKGVHQKVEEITPENKEVRLDTASDKPVRSEEKHKQVEGKNKAGSDIQNKKAFQAKEKEEIILPLSKPASLSMEGDFWDKLFPIKKGDGDNKESSKVNHSKDSSKGFSGEGWKEVAAGAETAAFSLETKAVPHTSKEFSLINGGRINNRFSGEKEREGSSGLLKEIEELRKENKNLLADLEKLYRRKEEMRQELAQMEEQLVSLRVERDAAKKRVSHLETRLMQLQGTLNKTVNDAQGEQARLKQQLREQEYRLQTTLIANEDLEQTVADLQRERQELKRQVNFWPVRLALRLAALIGLKPQQEKGWSKAYSRKYL